MFMHNINLKSWPGIWSGLSQIYQLFLFPGKFKTFIIVLGQLGAFLKLLVQPKLLQNESRPSRRKQVSYAN